MKSVVPDDSKKNSITNVSAVNSKLQHPLLGTPRAFSILNFQLVEFLYPMVSVQNNIPPSGHVTTMHYLVPSILWERHSVMVQ